MRRRYLRNRARGNIIYPGLIAAWSAKGKTNEDADRNVLKDLTGNGHDITLNNFAYRGMSGYGGFDYPVKSRYIIRPKGSIVFGAIYIKQAIPANTSLPNFDIQVSGFTNGKLYVSYPRGNYKKYLTNGLNHITDIPIASTIGDLFIDIINVTDFNQEIIVEFPPEYPDALVFDGVDDFGVNEDMPILTDYTIIAKRKWLNTINSQYFISKRVDNNSGAFNMEGFIRSKTELISFGTNNLNKVPISYFTENDITYISKNNYNGIFIDNGVNIDTNSIIIGANRLGVYLWQGAFYSAYLFDRSLDEQEIKAFIRKYIDPEYLLPSEILTPDCYYDFSLGSNDDENRETIVDQSGNGNNAVAHNFAWSGMSGYGGYDNIISNGTVSGVFCDKISNTEILIKQTHTSTISTFVFAKPSRNKAIYEIKGMVDGQVIYFGNDGNRKKILSVSKDGIYEVDWNDLYNINSNYYRCIYSDYIGDINCTIKVLPKYEGALVLDGVDDYISLDAFDSGFKTVFMVCNWNNENAFLYDQRQIGTSGNQWGIYTAQAAYSYRNAKGVTYINSILNTSLLSNNLLQKKHCITIVNENIEPNRIPIIGAAVESASSFANIALYKFLGFKEKLTEDQIQYVIKKYNLLDGVDEIEVS